MALARVLVLAPDPGATGGIQRVTRAVINVCADALGETRVGILAVWAGECDTELRGTMLRRPPVRSGEGARVTFVNKTRFTLGALRSAWRWREGLVIINVHAWLAPVAWLCHHLSGAPVVQLVHGTEVWFPMGWLRRATVRSADRSVSPSRYTADRLIERVGVDPATVRVIHNPFEEFVGHDAVRPAPANHPAPYILTVGRMDAGERRKGVDTTIIALARLRRAGTDVDYLVVGTGEDVPRLRGLAEREGVGDKVHFLERQTNDALAGLYRDAIAYVMPSGQEGYGLTYVEAAREGTPSIAASFAACPEVVLDGETGIIVPFADPGALARAIEHLVADSVARERLGRRAREVATERNGFEAFARSIMATLDAVAGGAA